MDEGEVRMVIVGILQVCIRWGCCKNISSVNKTKNAEIGQFVVIYQARILDYCWQAAGHVWYLLQNLGHKFGSAWA